MNNRIEKKKRRFPGLRLCCVCVVLTCSIISPHRAYGQAFIPLISPAAILMEQTTGKVLYARNEHTRMFPASMTKILTALVAVEYLQPDTIVVVGDEIYGLPGDAMRAGHVVGESITVKNLLRALIIRSGNETGRILALNTVKAAQGVTDISYTQAERIFCGMMNDKARALGARDTNFTNPHGLHDDNHYTTAYDLGLISRAYMENELLRQIAQERNYTGDGLEGLSVDGAKVLDYNWTSHNELITGGAYTYAYANGIKTGFTDQASDCVAASAEKNEVALIAVVFYSPSPGRWQDARLLFDYGFDTYAFTTIQTQDEKLDTAAIANARLGDSDAIAVLANDTAIDFLSQAEQADLQRVITYDPQLIAPASEESPATMQPLQLLAPIEKDQVLGTVRYLLNGEVVFEGTLRASETVIARTFENDVDYYLAVFKDNVFTLKALPYWFGVVGLLVGFIGILSALRSRRKRRDNRYSFRGYR